MDQWSKSISISPWLWVTLCLNKGWMGLPCWIPYPWTSQWPRVPQQKIVRGLSFDPFMISNHSIAPPVSCTACIRECVTVMPAERREGSSIKMGDIKLNKPESKPKLDSITLMQYMEASHRILHDMATKDGASLPQILQYVGYLIKVANMEQRFQWKSVLEYHAEYRKTQWEAGFADEAASSFIIQLHIRDEPVHNPSLPKLHGNVQHLQTKFDPRSDKPICGQLKATKVCQLQSCKFAHGCRASYNDHSLITAWILFCRDSDIVLIDRRTCWHWEHHPCTGVANNLATPPPPPPHKHTHTHSPKHQWGNNWWAVLNSARKVYGNGKFWISLLLGVYMPCWTCHNKITVAFS